MARVRRTCLLFSLVSRLHARACHSLLRLLQVYKGLNVEVEEAEFNQEAYDAALTKLRKQHCDIIEQPAGVPCADGDQIIVNRVGFLANEDGGKGEPLPALAGGEGVTVPLEPGKFMPGLVEGLVGACKDETKDIQVTFPPRSSAPQLAGKTAIFEVEVLEVQQRHLPEVGDSFAQRVTDDMTDDWKSKSRKLWRTSTSSEAGASATVRHRRI